MNDARETSLVTALRELTEASAYGLLRGIPDREASDLRIRRAILAAEKLTVPGYDYAAEFDRGPHGAAVERERENSVGCNQRDEGDE